MKMTEEETSRYRATLRRRAARERRVQRTRLEEVREAAGQAAALLRDEFGASRVVLFGSVAQGERLSARSDIDLAAWGLGPVAHLEAVARLQDCSAALSVDLVRAEHCNRSLRAAILEEGIDL